jgi:hypothetical protein
MTIVLATAAMIILHGATGGEIDINVQEITNMRGDDPGHPTPNFTKGVHCMISMSDGKYVTVRETCEEVRQIIGRPK